VGLAVALINDIEGEIIILELGEAVELNDSNATTVGTQEGVGDKLVKSVDSGVGLLVRILVGKTVKPSGGRSINIDGNSDGWVD
jgi:hypothetical protein